MFHVRKWLISPLAFKSHQWRLEKASVCESILNYLVMTLITIKTGHKINHVAQIVVAHNIPKD